MYHTAVYHRPLCRTPAYDPRASRPRVSVDTCSTHCVAMHPRAPHALVSAQRKTVVRCHEVSGNALTVCVLLDPKASSILVKGSANLLSFHTTRLSFRALAI